MFTTSTDILTLFPLKSKAQRQTLLDAISACAAPLGFPARTESAPFGSQNLLLGDCEAAPYLIATRCDNPCGVATIVELMRTLPENLRSRVCFVLFAPHGEGAYRRAHKAATDRQTVLRLDDFARGNELRFCPTPRLLKDKRRVAPLYGVCGYFGTKNLLVLEKGRAPSGSMSFPCGAGIAAVTPGKKHLPLRKPQADPGLDETNVNILRAALTTLLSRDAVKKGN